MKMGTEFWEGHVAAAKRETISASEYARRHGISVAALYYWQHKCRDTAVVLPGTSVTLSYRSEAFGRGKQKNRDRLKQLVDKGRINVMLKSTVKRVEPDKVTLNFENKEVTFSNDGVIVCAGGILPTPFLKEIGVMVETKFGTE